MKKHLASLSKGQALQVNTRQTENTKNMSPINIQTNHSRLTIAAGIAGRATGGEEDINEDTVFYKDGITTLCDAMGGGAPLNDTIIALLKTGLSLEDIASRPDITGHDCGRNTCINQIHVTPLSAASDRFEETPPPEQLDPDRRLDKTLQKRVFEHFMTLLNKPYELNGIQYVKPFFPLLFNLKLNGDLKTQLRSKHFKTLADVINLLDICTHHNNQNNQVERCIGPTSANYKIHTTHLIALAGETIITSSDGVFDNLTPEQISTIYQACSTPEEFVQTIDLLVQAWGGHDGSYFADINPVDPAINLDTMTIDYPLDTYPRTVALPNGKPLTFVKPPKQDNLSLAVESLTQDSQITIKHVGDCASILIGRDGSVKYITKQDSMAMRFREEQQAEFLRLIEAESFDPEKGPEYSDTDLNDMELPDFSNHELEKHGCSDKDLDMPPPMIEGGTDKKHTSDQDTTEEGHAKKAKR